MFSLVLCSAILSQYGHLAWSDEFDGNSLDLTKWTPQYGDGSQYGIPGWGNNEWQSYTDNPSNLFVQDGRLHIVAQKQGNQYTSARIRTLGKGEFTYGRMEASIKVPAPGAGLWPAFWMLPTNSPYGGWAAGGEIDIVEWINGMDEVHGTLHHGSAWPANQYTGGSYDPPGGAISGFHTYAIEWDPDQIRWYFDDVQYSQKSLNQWFTDSAPGDAEAPFDWNFHFILNLAVGGNWPGYPDGSTPFPATLEVDWVRVWKREAPSAYADHQIPGVVEAENYDRGGQSVGYWDADHTNNGGFVMRADQGVDIGSSGGGGAYVGWLRPMEWLQFTSDVLCGGEYLVRAKVASASSGGRFHLELHGLDLTGPIVVPATEGWQDWVEVEAVLNLPSDLQLPLRFVNDGTESQEFNIDSFTFERIDSNPDCNEVSYPCCLSSGCEILTTTNCVDAGGSVEPSLGDCGSPSDCFGTGACCFPDGTCVNATQASCAFGGGAFQGLSEPCNSTLCPLQTGACCLGDSCTSLEEATCQAAGGVFNGAGTSCEAAPECIGTGACCFADASCTNATQENCSFGGGIFQGSSAECATTACPQLTGACCVGSSCAILEASLCEQAGGVFGGEASSCTEVSCSSPCPGDFNSDSVIGFDDLLFILSDWDGTQADLDGSGTTDFADVLILLAAFGPC